MVGSRITKAITLRGSIAFALRGVKLAVGKRYMKPELTEDQRYEIADKAIDKLRRAGWKELDDELPTTTGPTGATPSQR